MSDQLLWYTTRGAGAVSLVLLSVVVVLGLLARVRFETRGWPRFLSAAVHRDLALMTLVFLLLHIVTAVVDPFTHLGLVAALVPFGSYYRTVWLGLGTIAFELLIAIVATSLLRQHIGARVWRAIHWLAYASWPIAVLHGLGSGSDTKAWWSLLITVACVFTVAVAVWIRFQQVSDLPVDVRTPALAATVAVPIAIAVFTVAGPLQKGWAAKAGTPNTLLASASFAGTGRSVRPPSRASIPPAVRLPFSASLAGTVTQSNAPGGAVVDISLRVSGGAHGRLRVRLAGAPIGGGGLSLIGSQVVLATKGMPSAMEGAITSLVGQRFDAHLRDAYGHGMYVHVNLNIDNGNGTATGSLSADQ